MKIVLIILAVIFVLFLVLFTVSAILLSSVIDEMKNDEKK